MVLVIGEQFFKSTKALQAESMNQLDTKQKNDYLYRTH